MSLARFLVVAVTAAASATIVPVSAHAHAARPAPAPAPVPVGAARPAPAPVGAARPAPATVPAARPAPGIATAPADAVPRTPVPADPVPRAPVPADPAPRTPVPADPVRPVPAPAPVRNRDRGGDHLTVTVRRAGDGADGTYELLCHPGGGSHPDADGACAALDRRTTWGKDLFAPVPDGSVCTMQYGGPATAHVTGSWAGRPVDASYDRSDGCEIGRWDRLVPLLPDLRPHGRP